MMGHVALVAFSAVLTVLIVVFGLLAAGFTIVATAALCGGTWATGFIFAVTAIASWIGVGGCIETLLELWYGSEKGYE